jgi:hypothetical protein
MTCFHFICLKRRKIKFSGKPKIAKWQIIALAPAPWPVLPVPAGVDIPVFAAKLQSLPG